MLGRPLDVLMKSIVLSPETNVQNGVHAANIAPPTMMAIGFLFGNVSLLAAIP